MAKIKILCLALALALLLTACAGGGTTTGTETADASGTVTSGGTAPSGGTVTVDATETSGAVTEDGILPAPVLRDGDTVTDITEIENVSLIGEEKKYTVRIVMLDTADGDVTGKACYLDAVDMETCEVIAYKRIAGASAVWYKVDGANGTAWMSVTSVSYDKETERLNIVSGDYTFTNMDSLGAPIDPCFSTIKGGASFNQRGVNDSSANMFDYQIINLSNQIQEEMSEKADYTFAASNDSAFTEYCGSEAPTAAKLGEMWERIESVADLAEKYGLFE